MSLLSFVNVSSVCGFPSSVKTPPTLIFHPVYPQAERGVSSGIAGQLQDPEETHCIDYTGALKAACISPYRSRNIYLHTEACQKGAVPPSHAHSPYSLLMS